MKEKPGIPPPHSEAHMHEVITRYRTMVYGIALARVRTRADADDVFQEVFLAYFRGAPAFSEEEPRKAWLIQKAAVLPLCPAEGPASGGRRAARF